MTAMTQRVLDVSALPQRTADNRALVWWGNLAMLAIEGTMFAMLFATYLYLRLVNVAWPPPSVPRPELLWPTINLAILAGSLIPAMVVDRAALRENLTAVRIGQTLCVVAAIVFLAIRVRVMADLGFKWSDHAYGSIVWSILGFHTFHVIAATGETALLLLYGFVRPVERKQLLDFRTTAIYWYFVVATWVPFYFVIFVMPWGHRK